MARGLHECQVPRSHAIKELTIKSVFLLATTFAIASISCASESSEEASISPIRGPKADGFDVADASSPAPQMSISVCTSNANGSCARYAQHGITQRFSNEEAAEGRSLWKIPECDNGFAKVDLVQDADGFEVTVTCRVDDPTSGGGIVL